MVENESRIWSRESERGLVWAFICSSNARQSLPFGLNTRPERGTYLLDEIRGGDEVAVPVVDERVSFRVEQTDLRVQVVLLLDQRREGGCLDERGVVDVRVERGRV